MLKFEFKVDRNSVTVSIPKLAIPLFRPLPRSSFGIVSVVTQTGVLITSKSQQTHARLIHTPQIGLMV